MEGMLFSKEEMSALLRQLPQPEPPQDYATPVHFPDIHRAKRITLDIETHDPDLLTKGPGPRRDGYIVGFAINVNDGEFVEYFPVKHRDGPNCPQALQWLVDNLCRFRGELVGANLLYDLDYLQYEGVDANLFAVHDIQFAEPLIDEHAPSYSLETLAQKYLGMGKATLSLEALYGPRVKQAMAEVHPGHMRTYALQDVILPSLILDKQRLVLAKERLLSLFELESQLIPLLLYMRKTGVRVDLERAAEAERILAARRDAALLGMKRIVGFDVDPDSGESISRACQVLGIDHPYTDKGNPSFVGDWLRSQAAKDWIDEMDEGKLFFRYLLDARKYEKARNPFLTNYILGSHINGRIHALFHPLRRVAEDGSQQGTVSGRFSSTHPNLQNIPARDPELGPLLRSFFLPEPGFKWLSYDYSQIEYRMFSHFAVAAGCEGAESIQKKYIADPNTDFHAAVAELTGVSRKEAKNVNFALLYGAGPRKLASMLGLLGPDGNPTQRALDIMEQYHERAPFAKELLKKISHKAAHRGYVTTILKRRARFNLWEPSGQNAKRGVALPKEEATRLYGDKIQRAQTYKALNSVLQGSAADLAKKALVDIWKARIIDESLALHLLVHDEFDFSIEDPNDKRISQIKELMENAVPLKVPVKTEAGLGDNWSEAH